MQKQEEKIVQIQQNQQNSAKLLHFRDMQKQEENTVQIQQNQQKNAKPKKSNQKSHPISRPDFHSEK